MIRVGRPSQIGPLRSLLLYSVGSTAIAGCIASGRGWCPRVRFVDWRWLGNVCCSFQLLRTGDHAPKWRFSIACLARVCGPIFQVVVFGGTAKPLVLVQ